MRKSLAIAMSVLVIFGSGMPAIGGGFNKSGRTAFQFVKIGIGARQVALGEA
jgi:hypothetical protein